MVHLSFPQVICAKLVKPLPPARRPSAGESAPPQSVRPGKRDSVVVLSQPSLFHATLPRELRTKSGKWGKTSPGGSRSSRTSRRGRWHGGRREPLSRPAGRDVYRRHPSNDLSFIARNLLGRGGLRYNGEAVVPGAQTERRGEAGPMRGLLGGKDLTGRFVLFFNRSEPLGSPSEVGESPQVVPTVCPVALPWPLV